MVGWKEYKLGNFVESVSETYKFKPNESVVFLNTSDIHFGKVINRDFTNSANLPGQAKKRIKNGDFLFSEIRPANGRYALIDFEAECYVVSTKLMVLRCNKKIDRDFFRIFLTSKDQLEYLQMIAEDRSGTFPQITFDHISDIDIILPPLPEQKAIAGVLSSLDDKIDLLQRQNKTLEGMAEALWWKMFVEDAEENWLVKGLDEIASFLNGLPCQKYPSINILESLPVIKIKELRTGITENSDLASSKVPSEYIINNGDVLFSWSGSLDVVIWSHGKGVLNQHLFKVYSNDYPKWFYYFGIKDHLLDFRSIAESKATTMGHIQRHHLSDAKVLIPDKKTLNYYDNLIAPLFEKLVNNMISLKDIEKTRDILLPKLMCGEVRVKL